MTDDINFGPISSGGYVIGVPLLATDERMVEAGETISAEFTIPEGTETMTVRWVLIRTDDIPGL